MLDYGWNFVREETKDPICIQAEMSKSKGRN